MLKILQSTKMATPPREAQALLPQPTTPISKALETSKKLLHTVDLLPDCFLGFSKDTVKSDISNEQLTTIPHARNSSNPLLRAYHRLSKAVCSHFELK